MTKRILCIALLLTLSLAGTMTAASTIKLSAYVESNLQLKPDGADKWRLNEASDNWNPKSIFDLKLDIKPFADFIIWMRARMSTSLDDRNDPLRFSYDDLHLEYLKKIGNGGFKVNIFLRENSYFWMDQPLIRLTDNNDSWGQGDDKGDKGSLNGIYFTAWNLFGMDIIRAVFVNDNMDDGEPLTLSAALRLRKSFFKGGLKIGMTGVGYRNSSKAVGEQGYEAIAFDMDTTMLGPFQFTFETALCFNNELISDTDPQQYAYKGELRGNFSLGAFGQTGFYLSAYQATEKFQNWRGNGSDGDNDNRFVERLEWYYNFPLKAIYIKEAVYYSHPVAGINPENFHLWNYSYNYVYGLDTGIRSQVTVESYSELYVEFKNGFKFKTYFKHTEGGEYVTGRYGKWNHLFFQLEVENRFAKIKPQVLMLNFNDSDNSATAFGGEVLINLTDNIKFYTRFAMVAGSKSILYRSLDDKRNWSTFFCELQFLKVFSNTEIFLTWGNGDHTNDDLVHDKNGGILNGQSMEKRVNLFIKYSL